MKSLPGRCWIRSLLWIGLVCVTSKLMAQSGESVPQDSMLAVLERMLAEDPGRADTWRLLGRVQRQQNRTPDALQSFQRSLELQPDNVAAHSDLGELLDQIGDRDRAAYHFNQVMLLAPSSTYAQKLAERGFRSIPPQAPSDAHVISPPAPSAMPNALSGAPQGGHSEQPPASEGGNTELVGYDIPTFDGADELERGLQNLEDDTDAAVKRWRTFVEFGALYNTNVSLTPISRGLTNNDAASYQGFLSPDVEWTALSTGPWRTGPLLRGYFTVNEDAFQAFNLASFQPGAFVEKDLNWWDQTVIGRTEYVYSVDLMDGDRFGDRHAVTASLITILDSSDVIYSYFTTSYSQFTNDGAVPAIDSLDGIAFTTGISRFFQTEWARVPTWSLGADLEWADTEGDDYRYESITVHSDATLPLTARWSLIPRVGLGYRHYGDFTGPITRDELTYRLGARLRWKWSEAFSLSAVVSHDRFASDNEDFDSERTEGGIVATIVY